MERGAYNAFVSLGSRGPLCFLALLTVVATAAADHKLSWNGTLRDSDGNGVAAAIIALHGRSGNPDYSVATSSKGQFVFPELPAGGYDLSVSAASRTWRTAKPLIIPEDATQPSRLTLSASTNELFVSVEADIPSQTQGSGGEHLSSAEVSNLPLNQRDFSKLLLLAAGTMTDTNGAANFTQQFAINGQRGVAAVFAMDGADTTDPETGRSYVFQFQRRCHTGSAV